MAELFLFVSATIIGSFLNVCIYRLPQKVSVVTPASYCPDCGNAIAWYDKIPIISYLLLKAKCRHCRQPISFRYPFVELLTGAVTLILFYQHGWTPQFFFYTIFCYFLIVIAFIDWQYQIIHNKLLIVMLLFGMAFNAVFLLIAWKQALLGVALAGGVFLTLSLAARFIFGRESMGMGDVKFAAVAGFFLGFKFILVALYFGFLSALIFIIVMKLARQMPENRLIPMGTFFAIGIFVFLLWGNVIINFYFYVLLS